MMFAKTRLIALAAALAAGMLTNTASAAERLRVAGNFPAEHNVSRAMEVFKERAESLSKGEIKVDLFPAMQLGGATENIDQVRSGSIFAVFTSAAYFTRTVPEYEAVSLPFLFDNRDQAFKVMEGKVSEIINKRMGDLGFVVLGYGELGFRHLTNSLRPIATADDFKGLRIRLQPNEVHLASFRALGANPISMDVSELYSALQQGVLDGQENPYNIIASRRFNEVQKHLSDSGHFYDFIVVAANKRRFDKLSEENRKVVVQAMKEAVQWQRETAAAEELEWRNKLVAAGMTFTSVTPQARAAMREATAGIAVDLKKRVDPAVIDLVINEAKAAQ